MTTKQPSVRCNSALIEIERERLFAKMAQLRKVRGSSTRSIETAEVLLTRWWGKANWRVRKQLIRAADWTVRLERNRGVRPSA
jgi:hypothetical protein